MRMHPCADLFPLIEGREFEELVEDIRAKGLRTPILIDSEGRVLDGRNRLRACEAAGVEPRFETWDGSGSAAELVMSLNLHRRHLSLGQRALLGAKLKETLSLEAAARRRAGKALDLQAAVPGGQARDQAARLVRTSGRSIDNAAKVLRSGDPELIRDVMSGDLPVTVAAEKVGGGNKPRAPKRKSRLAIAGFTAGDMVLAVCAPPGRLAEAVKLIEQWGFERCATK